MKKLWLGEWEGKKEGGERKGKVEEGRVGREEAKERKTERGGHFIS